MKFLVVLGFLWLGFCSVTANEIFCAGKTLLNSTEVPEWAKMVDSCTKKMKEQVQVEISASMQYLAMATHFAQDKVNRPGFSEFFFKSASEERQHAIKLIEYLLMRGQLTKDFNNLIQLSTIQIKHDPTEWATGLKALETALNLETKVTNSIRDIMNECEEPKDKSGSNQMNDFHLVDFLTTVYLEEQYHGQRDLAGKISTLKKMEKNYDVLAEFLFDKKLLSGEV